MLTQTPRAWSFAPWDPALRLLESSCLSFASFLPGRLSRALSLFTSGKSFQLSSLHYFCCNLRSLGKQLPSTFRETPFSSQVPKLCRVDDPFTQASKVFASIHFLPCPGPLHSVTRQDQGLRGSQMMGCSSSLKNQSLPIRPFFFLID